MPDSSPATPRSMAAMPPADGEPPAPRPGHHFAEMPAAPSLPGIEHEMLRRWETSKVFQRSLEQTAAAPLWTCYEGPPTANGMPGVHHIEARVFKDVFPRFKTMQGFHVPRQAGWDCHGLPVEVAVERELGLSGKKDIEAYGIAAFNQRCRESVLLHVDAFEDMTRRLGYWVDMAGAYRTMDPAYVESVWWSLKVIFDKGLLVRDHRISPYCPRCATPLSDHEIGQPDVYRTVTDPSVTVRFPLRSLPDGASPLLAGADLLVWTTTPWTLVSNTAVAVHPDETYVVARKAGDGDTVVVAEQLLGRVLGEGWHVLATMPGRALAGASYEPPFSIVDIPGAHVVITAPFVTTEDGTGLVHMAPAFGADDMEAGRAHGLPVVNPVGPDGRFEEHLPLVGGMFFKDADQPLLASLADRGLAFQVAPHEHSYPHCWRCHTPLLYYAVPSWFIRTTAIRDDLLAENERTNWQPPGIKHGRYGEWLRNNVDWALSRTRYWGTPLPLWVCEDGHVTCAGSRAELGELAGQDLSALDPHRPFVDDVVIGCRECGTPARRVPEVIDAWYDSGAMPFARHGAPFHNAAEFDRTYPAQFICEAIDQTRGWFYSLMAVGTLVFGKSSYENVVCLGLVVDDRGRKMSKHLGNVLQPMPMMDAHGADAVRWFFAASGSPWSTRRIGDAALSEIVRKVLLTYWNTVSFLVLYANAAGAQGQAWHPAMAGDAPPPGERPLLDRWALSELAAVTREVTASLEEFDTAAAGRRLAAFIDDLSNWYVRRSRRRFWDGPGTPDGAAAFATLYQCAETLTRLMAPFAPFLTDYVWNIVRPEGAPDSVHLASWPAPAVGDSDRELPGQMRLVRRLVELGRSARATAGIGARQPLPRVLVSAAGFGDLPAELREQIAAELNVRSLEQLSSAGDEPTDHVVKPNFRELGRRFGKQTPAVAAAITAMDPAALASELQASGQAAVSGPVAQAVAESLPGQVTASPDGTPSVMITPEDVIITETPREGWTVAAEAGFTVALETLITPELRQEGLAREVIRLIQEARKTDGLDVTDRISLRWQTADPELTAALAEEGELVASEVLATDAGPGQPDGDGYFQHSADELDLTFWLRAVQHAPDGGSAP